MEKLDRNWKASYTVEASWIMSICIFLIFFTLSVFIAMYKSTYEFLMKTDADEIEAVVRFRQIALGKEVLNIE